jgi:hypothetical protein
LVATPNSPEIGGSVRYPISSRLDAIGVTEMATMLAEL